MPERSAQPVFRASLVQMCSGRDPDRNTAAASELIHEAVAAGANYVLTPEVTNVMEVEREALFAAAEPEDRNRSLASFKALAAELSVWLHIGSLAIRKSPDKLANRSYLIAPDGNIAARYDKIHMFDVSLANGEVYSESTNYAAGSEAVVAAMPWGGLGMTICYDLRFPYLFRTLALNGARMIAVPAAFTRPTGEAHWHVLLRARAIETQCFVFAAAQGGTHEHGRKTYGHSLIISPWGEILAEGGESPGVVTADIDMSKLEEVRARVPSLRPNASFSIAAPAAGEAAAAGGSSR
ncbi:MAG: carbon-nitrogen hydrolase family protein [Alphaproteobacteria bacterium]|nr:carbon-nitrogen hydrolase family protein [Alphaproteobacteria bacterium]